ncbi:hypothetical protein EV384_6433 [Micromonospora kangleipakensis]|uniref:Uncharacterized protein n=1 Tax=Micromonospora kangleipakensis TaxID=1077942 RepID=A0A4Q8BJS6_9ACTN|nr:hypothetical protein [Micromonospora kangleipakensis]RZU77693.1 hypothetical protein EV384_6433 [Micromonospora kangleipakensis]
MGKHRRTSADAPQETATEDSGATYWSVDEADWPAIRPTLPAEMVDLLAPPIVVGVARVVATSRMTPPAEAGLPTRTSGTIRSGVAAGRPVPAGGTTVRIAVSAAAHPSGPAGSVPGGRPGPGPAPGQHRNG